MPKRYQVVLVLFCLACLCGRPTLLRASALWPALAEGLAYDLRVLGFGTFQQPADSSQNPSNDFLQLPRYVVDMEFRPDARLTLWRVDLSVKPRLNVAWQAWDDGGRSGDSEVEVDLFVNAWLARVGLTAGLFLSYGRENLQWGPSFLFSPSNPFFRENGRLNPKREVPGADFARLVWLPGPAWTLSFIANVATGRQDAGAVDFQKTYAFKLDYAASAAYASLVPSYREGDRLRLGWFGGWTATDALLLYAEGALSQGLDARYPVAADHAFGVALEAVKEDATSLESVVLLGGAYTLALGPTLAVEYLYNGPGYSASQAQAYYRLRQQAADAFTSAGPRRDLARLTLSRTADTGLRFLRRHYVLFQYVHNDIRDVLNLTFRWTQNLDDTSGQFNYILEYFLGDHTQLFSVGIVTVGEQDTEFGTFLAYQILLGVEYTF